MELTEKETEVLDKVRRTGAVVLRRVIDECGPRVNWNRLITEGWVQVYETVLGQVVTPTTKTRRAYPKTHYLTGPATVADRAYQVESVRALRAEGFRPVGVDYKESRTSGKATSIITRFIMQAPDRDDLIAEWSWQGEHHPRLGQPYLYANISGGGISPGRLRALLRVHRHDIDDWRSPVLVATPDPDRLRSTIRRIEVEDERLTEELLNANLSTYIHHTPYGRVRLVTVPLLGS